MPAPSATTPLPLHQRHQHYQERHYGHPRNDPTRSRFNWHVRKPNMGTRRSAAKHHMIAMIGEFCGTTLFLMLAFGGATVANIPSTSVTGDTTSGQGGKTFAAPDTSSLLYTAFSFGIALMVCVFIFFRVSGGLFNPAVAWGMLVAGAVTPMRCALLIISQILGCLSGAALIDALLPGTLNVRSVRGGGISIARAFWLEAFLTAVLMLSILLLAAVPNKAKHISPLVIGFTLFVCELVGVYYTGGSLNPARSFGPAVVLKEFSGYHWIYWLGPALGATIAAGLYRLLRALEFESVMPKDPEDGCNHPVIQLAPSSATGSTADIQGISTGGSGNSGSGVAGDDYHVEGTGFGELLERDDNSDDGYHNNFPRQLNMPNNDERFDRLERMMEQLLEAGQYRPARSSAEHSYNPRKGSVAGTLVEEPTLTHEKQLHA
ncbi:hypothetical protein JCM8547_007857 [Rhodosporidiobolus lusitaniae]